MEWIDIKINKDLPLERPVIIAHMYGCDYIMFSSAKWRHCYTGIPVEVETLKLITHWCEPISPSKNI